MTAAAWVQAIATCILIAVTIVYVLLTWRIARRTSQAAEAARDSAQAAKEALLAGNRPMLALEPSGGVQVSAGSPDSRFDVVVNNIGTGAALYPELFVEVTGTEGSEKGDVFNRPRQSILEPNRPDAKYQFDAPHRLSREDALQRLLIVCHYQDLFGSETQPRVYHSVYEKRPHGKNEFRYFRPEMPIPEDYLRLCEICMCKCRQ